MTLVQSRYPLAYFITFRTYGTWLHGDERGSTDRHRNRYASPKIPSNPSWLEVNAQLLMHPPVTLDSRHRQAVDQAIRETCDIREWRLRALNVRTNHVHVVVTAACEPAKVMNAFKANATRQMRDVGCWKHEYSPWAHGGSKRHLWTEQVVQRAVTYVVEGQGGALPGGG
jgi:REP element-mobilizing transposase RayT